MKGEKEIVAALGMRAHPEGGWYVETWRAPGPEGTRPPGSAILYFLAAGERSHWHRLDAAEVWQYSAGEALELRVWVPGQPAVATHRLGPEVGSGDVEVRHDRRRRTRERERRVAAATRSR